MIEIIVLIRLTKVIGRLALQKGLKLGTWKLYCILAWFGAEVFGIVVGQLLIGDVYSGLLLGYIMAIISYFVLKQVLKNKPDKEEDWLSQIGQDMEPADPNQVKY